MIAFNIVDDLYQRTIVAWQVIEYEWPAVLYDGKPLPVGMSFGRKGTEDGM